MSSILEHVYSRRNLNKNRVENLKTCEQGIFCRVRTLQKNPAKWEFAWQLHVHVGLKPIRLQKNKTVKFGLNHSIHGVPQNNSIKDQVCPKNRVTIIFCKINVCMAVNN